MRTLFRHAAGIGVAALAAASPAGAQGSTWAPARCDLKPGHYLVNSGVLYLKNASTTKFEDQRQKDLGDGLRVLKQALGSGQSENAAAWYYLARYYAIVKDLVGADSAFTKAQALQASCAQDIDTWRKSLWVPMINAGIAAWQAGNTDSAMASFRRANEIYRSEPMGMQYLATLLANADQPDSAVKYFRLAVEAAGTEPKRAQEKKESLFNLARVYHRAQRWNEAAAAYREYRALAPNDAEALAGLAAVFAELGFRDSAMALYTTILERADSVPSLQLFNAGVEIYRAAPPDPDTAKAGTSCRTETKTANRTWTPRRIAMHCDSLTRKMFRENDERGAVNYRLAARAFELGLARNPYYRDALFNLANTYLILQDSAKTLPVAEKLHAVDPLNRSSTRLLAAGWQLKGKGDSALHYLIVADSTLPVDVSIGTFALDDQGAQLSGIVSNPREKPSPPISLVVEFLDEKGTTVATQNVAVPALEAGGTQALQLKVTGAGIVAWRYRKT